MPQASIPCATYRLQFNKEFKFSSARLIIGYLHDLGISHLYASSYFAAREGSMHGYDVVNQNAFNREIGSEEEYREMVAELMLHGMGQILDIVPNHMCIESEENIWWMDVLESGQSSPYARFFDIDWIPVKKELTSKVLLPFLADQYGKVLEKGDLHLVFRKGAFWITYFQLHMPVEPKSCLRILEHRLDALRQRMAADDPALMELLSIITSLQHLPLPTEQDADRREERSREKEVIKKRLGQLYEENAIVAVFIRDNLEIFNGTRGDSHSFDLLDGLLRDQVYRLSYWRVATEEINYRRFFDINGLAAIRMEDEAVFKETHKLLLRLIRENLITGVRIDHVDGLYDPLSYLNNLQKEVIREPSSAVSVGAAAEGGPQEPEEAGPVGKPLYLLCEKILLKGEHLPEEWPVHGTTGYDFLGQVNGIFVDTENAKAFDRIYNRFIGRVADFADVVYVSKKLVMEVALSGEVNMLANRLNALSEQNRQTRDFTLNSLARAISEMIAFFPVYRTYVNSWTIREKDSLYIETAINKARRKNPAISVSIFDFLRSVLLLKWPEDAPEGMRADWLNFSMRFQQLTGPVMAKGMEDTSYYLYNRLISLNEVGGMPGRFGSPLEVFHGQNMERFKSFPHSLVATATHDTKRGEDARLRINVLSEVPDAWHAALVRWTRFNKRKFKLVDNQRVPDHNEEYLLYQTLIGVWPTGSLNQEGLADLRARIREYLTKAVREAKVNSSWVSPDVAYEEALLAFADAILEDLPDNQFLKDFLAFQQMIARCGMYGSLSQTLLKMTSPGVPDFYQGTELWDFSLVDPDNRNAVDYRIRCKALVELKSREAEIGPVQLLNELLENWKDGRIKLYLIFRCLNFRRHNRKLFDQGAYLPLEVRGSRARHICAFSRQLNGSGIIAVASRFFTPFLMQDKIAPLGEQAWADTRLILPYAKSYRNVLTGELLHATQGEGGARLALGQLFSTIPVALLEAV